MTTSVRISGLVLCAGLAWACADEETDRGASDQEAMGELEADLALAGDPGDLERGPMGPMGPLSFLRCDEDPDLEFGTVCGRTVPVAIHLEWSDCADRIGSSSGTADITTDAGATDCGSGFERQLAFELTRSLPGGASATAVGGMSIEVQRGADGPSALLNGAVDVALPVGQLDVAISDLVRVPAECGYPIAGQVARAMPDGTEHLLVFGPECGQATADGEPVDLSSWTPPGPRPGGGF